jgi:hypothetical protein
MRTEAIVEAARNKGTAKASGGAWHALLRGDGAVTVRHYATDMIEIFPNGDVIPLSRGWGSVSDKQGINKILRYERTGVVYADIFG